MKEKKNRMGKNTEMCCSLCSSYIGLDDHPGVGQTHVAFSAEELQPLLQVPLSIVIDLKQQVNL